MWYNFSLFVSVLSTWYRMWTARPSTSCKHNKDPTRIGQHKDQGGNESEEKIWTISFLLHNFWVICYLFIKVYDVYFILCPKRDLSWFLSIILLYCCHFLVCIEICIHTCTHTCTCAHTHTHILNYGDNELFFAVGIQQTQNKQSSVSSRNGAECDHKSVMSSLNLFADAVFADTIPIVFVIFVVSMVLYCIGI